jgi:adenosylcobinamide-GDP ribazoletransferase
LSILSGLRNALAFLTIIPVGMDENGIIQAAEYMPSFPIIGALIGLAAGVLVWGLRAILPPPIAGMLGLGFILLLTGAHHADGLLDFGDAIMVLGSPEEKIRVMRDHQTGAGGLCLGLVVLSTTAFGMAALDRSIIIPSLVLSEASSKFAMVLQAWTGSSAHEGLNTPFLQAMHGKWRSMRLGIAFFLTLAISLVALQVTGIAVMLGGLLVAAAMLLISKREFGGMTGDVMGATNELVRLASLLVILVIPKCP